MLYKEKKGRVVMEEIKKNRDWKEKNKKYLRELQLFLDLADGIRDEKMRQAIKNQMLICDETLTKIAEKEIEKALMK